jgi:hypothetical protein
VTAAQPDAYGVERDGRDTPGAAVTTTGPARPLPDDTVAAVAALLPGERVELAGTIRRTERSEVLRVRAAGYGTLIVKRHAAAGSWARESAALAVAPSGAPVPALVAASGSPPVVVMTDAGTGPSLADALLTGGAEEAARCTERFAVTLAALHLSTRRQRDVFVAELSARAGAAAPGHSMPGTARRAASDLRVFCGQLGVTVPDGALRALADLPDLLAASGPSALTPADVCPDNNVRAGDGYVLIDFEEAEWRPVAWDAAYLTVPWPSCWCSFRLPSGVASRALAEYRAALASMVPYAATPGFDRDVAVAATGWALITTSWFLRNALGEDPPLHDVTPPPPTRRAVILHRLGTAARGDAIPVLAEFAARLRTQLVHRWGEVPLALPPAFR